MRNVARAIALLACFGVAAGCGENDREAPVVQIIALTGFDPLGEPQVRVLGDGSLRLDFEFIPPSWAPEDPPAEPGDAFPSLKLGRFHDFDKQLERALDVEVYWEDREFFIIRKPRQDTIERLSRFLSQYPRN